MKTTHNLLDEAFRALRNDLIHEDGPQISTMRNYRFAIVPYEPEDEYKLRSKVHSLVGDLTANGWVVLTLSLQKLLLARVRSLGDDTVEKLIQIEKRTSQHDRERGFKYLCDKLSAEIEGPNGIAADVAQSIRAFADANPDKADRTLTIVGRAGALYPFFRTSALLKHLDGRTNNIPVVLLYPGQRQGPTALSFMGQVNADSDYRPRIYP